MDGLLTLGPTTRQADPALVAELERTAHGLSFEEQPEPRADLADLDLAVLSELRGRPTEVDDLLALGLAAGQGGRIVPTYAGILAACPDPTRFLPSAWVQCGRLRGPGGTDIFDQIEIHGPMPLAIDKAMDFLLKHAYKTAVFGEVRRRDVYSIPVEPIREVIVNALVHASYAESSTPIRIGFYDDRIQVDSPGLLLPRVGEHFRSLYASLPFDLTEAQKRVLREIQADVVSGRQMNRLVQGDVGSGKTLVALFAMLLAVDNGHQACLMAPTEILARQHHASLAELLEPLGLEVGLLIGSTRRRERTRLHAALASGELPILVGTHALIEPSVHFHSLALCIIDEQHRFGVVQRSGLWAKNASWYPHILTMSATPIPRTLAMTLYGDLDISVIDELPPGRKPIQTYHVSEGELFRVYRFLEQQISEGRQAYVVFPMIEEQEQSELRALQEGMMRYRERFPELEVVMVHGKMKPEEKDAQMQRFVSGEAQILLATTVIEVGVNVPNASVMVIEGANRFGLAQLHQLRGRVGRGASQSYCILVTGSKLGEEAQRRLQLMVETNDGFEIAEADMRFRGFGEIDGTRQSGQLLSLRIANPATDGAMVQYTRELAERILEADPELSQPEHAPLRRRLDELFRERPSWSQIS